MIPKIIHQTNKEVTVTVEASRESIKQTHPDWEYRFWTDDDVKKLIKDSFSQYYDYWSLLPDSNIEKWDIARYLIIWHYGGMYVDVDTLFYKNMNEVLDLRKSLIFIKKSGLNWVKNHFFLSMKNDPFWAFLMSDIMKTKNNNIHARTGGIRLFRSLLDYSSKEKNTQEIQYLDPNFVVNENLKWEGNFKSFNPDDVYVKHLANFTWK
jgi:mannosyltransferase OCH1-like enzyme